MTLATQDPNPNIIFFYYSGSKDTPKPGHGSGESILEKDEPLFLPLADIPKWRTMLSNFWVAPFTLDGLRWASVEHYYQGSKFKNTPEFYREFSLDSESEISKDPFMAKAAGGKSGKYKGVSLRPDDIIIDPEFFDNDECNVHMYNGMYAKFSQNADLLIMLLYSGFGLWPKPS